MTEYGYEPGQIHPEYDVIVPEPVAYSPWRRQPAPPPPPPPPVSVRSLLDARPGRGRVVQPEDRRRLRHECKPPDVSWREGATWDCPLCGRVWIAEWVKGEHMVSREWVRAPWRVARAHREALR